MLDAAALTGSKPLRKMAKSFEVTAILSNLFYEYPPTVAGVRKDWKGWLMGDAGRSLEKSTSARAQISQMIGSRLAALQ